MRTRGSAALVLMVTLVAFTGCGATAHHPTITKATPITSFASDQSAEHGHVVSAKTTGTVLATDGFTPTVDGFSFENYGFIAGTEIDQHDMRELFGDQVCATSPSDACTLTPAAQQWAEQTDDAMMGGHCFGFSVTALRFFQHLLGQSQFGGATTFSLSLTPALQSEIAYGWAMQMLSSVQRAITGPTPTQMVKFLEHALAAHGSEVYTIGIKKADGSDGHAITPIAVEDLGNGQFDIDIYDNNYPGVQRAISVDTNADTWTYNAAPNPSDPQGVYNGQGTTNPMELIPLTPGLGKQPCPFCGSGGLGATRQGTMRVSLGGDPVDHGHLLITTAGGQRLGYVHGRFVDDIKGARVYQPLLTEVWKARPEPIYELPAGAAITVTLDGAGATGANNAAIHITGPGFGATVTGLRPQPGTIDRLALALGGSALSLHVVGSAPGQAPTIQLARNAASGGSELTATPAALPSGGALTLALNRSSNQLSVARAGAGGSAPVAVSLAQIDSSGARIVLSRSIPLAPGRQAVVRLRLGAG